MTTYLSEGVLVHVLMSCVVILFNKTKILVTFSLESGLPSVYTGREVTLAKNIIIKTNYISLIIIKTNYIIIYHILSSDYAEYAQRDIDDVTITHIRTPCKNCISISVRVQKMHINDVTMKMYVTTNKYFRILSSFVTVI